MEIKTVYSIYFSPTGTTRTIIDAVARGLNPEQVIDYDLTYEANPVEQQIDNGVALIGVPVYAGRVPESCLERLSVFSAHTGVPTVLIALYGNREFEDALVELKDISERMGFNVVAAAAFIGEHSYSTEESPIAAGRPNADDIQFATAFGQRVAAKIHVDTLETPDIEGNVPYRERVKFGGIAPETDAQACVLCGQCAKACPVHIVSVTDEVTTDAQDCIMCSACLRACKFGARTFEHPVIQERRDLLVKHCSLPKKPTLFL